jgi:hypothetical protein
VFQVKFGLTKASLVENMNKQLKRRLYMGLRHLLSDDWPALLDTVVEGLNKRYLKTLGGFRPCDIKTPEDDIKIQDKVGLDNLNTQPPIEMQLKNQKKYEKNARNLIQKNTYVKTPTDPKFGRSFDTQVSITLGSV